MEKTISEVTSYTLTEDELSDLLEAAHNWGLETGITSATEQTAEDFFGYADCDRVRVDDFERCAEHILGTLPND